MIWGLPPFQETCIFFPYYPILSTISSHIINYISSHIINHKYHPILSINGPSIPYSFVISTTSENVIKNHCDLRYFKSGCGGFRYRGTPSHHPFLDGTFTYKPSFLGISPAIWNPPYSHVKWPEEKSRSPGVFGHGAGHADPWTSFRSTLRPARGGEAVFLFFGEFTMFFYSVLHWFTFCSHWGCLFACLNERSSQRCRHFRNSYVSICILCLQMGVFHYNGHRENDD